ncbi:MAG: hypothetical protein JJ975_02890 [Bacteroidia bacterium]|nr:hypothetical protein [Bacteroidia bacterium]
MNHYLHHIFTKFVHLVIRWCNIRFLLTGLTATYTTLLNAQVTTCSANYHSAAIRIDLPASWDSDLSSECKVEYRQDGQTTWLKAFEADLTEYGNTVSFRTSLFHLEPETKYFVRGVIIDQTPVLDSLIIQEQSFVTRTEPYFPPTTHVFWVSPDGSGTAYTESTPGDLKTLLKSGLSCGSTVLLKGGSYPAGDMTLNLYVDCDDKQPIIIRAAPNARPVIDGGYYSKLNWKQNTGDSLMYSATLPSEVAYTNLMVLNNQRLYPYSTVGSNAFLGNYHLTALNFGSDGFCRNANSIYLKTREGVDPDTAEVILSSQFRGLTIQGNGKNVFLRIKGLVFQHFGKSRVDLSGGYVANCLGIRNCNEVVLDSCEFRFNDVPLQFQGGCSNLTVQHCTFLDNIGDWSHAMIKKTVSNQNQLYPTSMGRSLENAGIHYSEGANGSQNVVYRYNIIQGIGDGIGFRTLTTGIYNMDFYQNSVSNCFDGVEFDGLFSNLKVWGNVLDSNVSSISIAPPRLGPAYFYRNTIHHTISRRNTKDDTYLVRCEPPSQYRSQGVGIKSNIGDVVPDASRLHFVNNTFHSTDSNSFVQYLWDDEWKHIDFRNNIFYNPSNTLFFNNGVYQSPGQLDTNFQFSSASDCYYSGNQPLLEIKEVHGQYNCEDVFDLDSLMAKWSGAMNTTSIRVQNALQLDPQFVDEAHDDFALISTSRLIENGEVVHGFYDFKGRAPDIGARESNIDSTSSVQLVSKPEPTVLLYPNPASTRVYTSMAIDQLVDVSGRQYSVRLIKRTARNGLIMREYDLRHIKQGVYIFRFDNQLVKLVKLP